MALDNFIQKFMDRYEDTFYKVNVSSKIANYRTEPMLTYGDTVKREVLDLTGIRVRAITDGVDRTIDQMNDTEESMVINVKVGASFSLPNSQRIKAGPLDPALKSGSEVAKKLNNHLDAVIFAETRNAFAKFDNGSLSGGAASGTPITLNSTTVPQMVTMAPARLAGNYVTLSNTCWVVDDIAKAIIAQHPIGKDITSANTIFLNGFNGPVYGSDLYTSQNLTGTAVITGTGTFSDGETIVITAPSGTTITCTAKTTIGATEGNFLIGANLAASLTNLAGLLNAPTTTSATQVAFSTAVTLIALQDELRIGTSAQNGVAVVATATTVTIVGVGSGRLVITEIAVNASVTSSYISCYFGNRGGIDVAVQENIEMTETQEPRQKTKNYLADITAAVKTFADGAKNFVEVKVSAV
jgi:hypothetical protein